MYPKYDKIVADVQSVARVSQGLCAPRCFDPHREGECFGRQASTVLRARTSVMIPAASTPPRDGKPPFQIKIAISLKS